MLAVTITITITNTITIAITTFHLLKVHEELDADKRAEVAEAGADARAEAAILQGKELANQ